jgi:putative ABC transport system substrate-binding protein
MRRREFVGGLLSAATWSAAARAQKSVMPVIGFLHSDSPEPIANRVAAFRNGLREGGYIEGQNVAIEYRWAHNDNNRLPELAADLVLLRVTVIVAPGSFLAALAAKAATTTIPIVFQIGSDAVNVGLVASLSQPGGNITGISSMNQDRVAKQLGLLQELLPGARRFALLVNPTSPIVETQSRDLQVAASAIGQQIEVVTAVTSRDIDTAFADLAQKGTDGLVVTGDPLFNSRRVQLATLAVHYAMPAIYPWREVAEAGGLMSYGSNVADLYLQTGEYTSRILKGQKPADLPVARATKSEFVVNLQTAKALGLTIPPSLLARADEVIE